MSVLKFLKSKQGILIYGFLWMLLLVLPWGRMFAFEGHLYLVFLIDMLRLAIAISVFIIPGALFYYLLKPDETATFGLSGLIPLGFSFSVLIIAVIGLTAKICGFSFGVVRSLFALIGGIELMLLILLKPAIRFDKKLILKSLRSLVQNPPLVAALILAALMTFHDYLFFIDDLSYLAYLTNWQHSNHLGFTNIVQAVDTVENPRFWLAMFPMGQALLADMSGVPGILLLGNYLELFLVPIAILASYLLARTLGLSRKGAGYSVLIQVSLYTWMNSDLWPVGRWFFQSMAEDKVAAVFLLSPVFFVFLLRYLQSPIKSNLLLVLLSGLGLMLTHPVILFYTYFVGIALTLFIWINRRTNLRAIIPLGAVFIASMLPYVAIRFSEIPTQKGMPFDAESAAATYEAERYINVRGDVFYGLNIELLKFLDIPPESRGYGAFQFFRIIPILVAGSAGLMALLNLRKGAFYWYILAGVLLVFLAALPYTGWILGYFVSSRMLARAGWYSPLGLSGVLIMRSVRDWLKSRHLIDEKGKFVKPKNKSLTLELLGMGSCITLAGPMLLYSLFFRAPQFFDVLNYNRQLAQIGTYIDNHTSDWVTAIALNYWQTQLLPGVSAHTELVAFREEAEWNTFNGSFSIEEIRARIYASDAIRSLDSTISPEERCFLMRKYDVRYVVARTDYADPYEALVSDCGWTIDRDFQTEDLTLLEFK